MKEILPKKKKKRKKKSNREYFKTNEKGTDEKEREINLGTEDERSV